MGIEQIYEAVNKPVLEIASKKMIEQLGNSTFVNGWLKTFRDDINTLESQVPTLKNLNVQSISNQKGGGAFAYFRFKDVTGTKLRTSASKEVYAEFRQRSQNAFIRQRFENFQMNLLDIYKHLILFREQLTDETIYVNVAYMHKNSNTEIAEKQLVIKESLLPNFEELVTVSSNGAIILKKFTEDVKRQLAEMESYQNLADLDYGFLETGAIWKLIESILKNKGKKLKNWKTNELVGKYGYLHRQSKTSLYGYFTHFGENAWNNWENDLETYDEWDSSPSYKRGDKNSSIESKKVNENSTANNLMNFNQIFGLLKTNVTLLQKIKQGNIGSEAWYAATFGKVYFNKEDYNQLKSLMEADLKRNIRGVHNEITIPVSL